jgi:phytoene desaturase
MHDYSGFFKIFNADFIKAIPKFSLGRSLFSVLGDYYPTPEARLCFTFQSKYLGMSPWVCPGAFGMIPFIEHSMGIFHVKGGLAKISEVMADIFQKKGGTLKYGSEVKEIIFEGKRAIGLKVADGSEEKFDEIIMNADFGYAMTNLMQNKVPKYKKEKVAKKKYSCSTVMLYLGLKKKYDTQFHTIVFADDYKQNVENISKGIFSYPDFSFYMRNGSVLDKSMAPAGHCALYILIPVPNKQLAKNIDWHEAKNELRKKVLDVCKEKFGMVDIEEHIAVEKMITPDEWEMDYNVFFGATFNLAHNLGQMLWLRPHNKLECVRGVYLVGGGTHPGSGLPTIYQSARISSELICEKYGIKSEASSL